MHGWLVLLLLAPLPVLADRTTADLDAQTIVARAHEAAGGEAWRHARALILSGNATFYRDGAHAARASASSYRMWRQFPGQSEDAHAANGRVRFDARSGDTWLFQISFDGEHSYDRNGRVDDDAATEQWKSNFGFGIIRFALEDGFSLRRMADDSVEGHPCYFIEVRDPRGLHTLFAIDRESYAIRMVGFDTPRGFHHRVYDDFYRKPGVSFTQPEHVRLYYDGVKTADIRWTDFELDPPIDPQHFVLEKPAADAGRDGGR
jgi:hypothetical protein